MNERDLTAEEWHAVEALAAEFRADGHESQASTDAAIKRVLGRRS